MRLIDADAVEKITWQDPSYTDPLNVLTEVREKVRALPTVDAVPVRKGEWVCTGKSNIYGGISLRCPFCGDEVMVSRIEDEIYCRHCGAKLREEECG